MPTVTAMTMTRRTLLFAGAALASAVPAATALPATAWAAEPLTLSLPAPTGRYRVGTTTHHLVDRGRRDPLAPDSRPRELMVRLLYPAVPGRTPTAAYLSPVLSGLLVGQFNAIAGTDYPPELLTFPTHSRAGAPMIAGTHPLVLFSPGQGTNAAFYTALLEDLASHGYVVAAIDPTFDAVVEFPDGRVEAPAEGVPFELLLRVRVDDMRYVLDRLAGRPGIGAVAAVGHSMGSMTTVGAIDADRRQPVQRIRAGVLLDGNPLGPASLDRPLLMLGNPSHRRDLDPDWADFYDRLRGPRLHAVVDGMGHYDLSDITAFKAVADLGDVFELGTIDGQRALAITRAYLRAWLDRSLLGRPSPLLVREPRRFPEVDFQP
jgi:dienelactone hydrolase